MAVRPDRAHALAVVERPVVALVAVHHLRRPVLELRRHPAHPGVGRLVDVGVAVEDRVVDRGVVEEELGPVVMSITDNGVTLGPPVQTAASDSGLHASGALGHELDCTVAERAERRRARWKRGPAAEVVEHVPGDVVGIGQTVDPGRRACAAGRRAVVPSTIVKTSTPRGPSSAHSDSARSRLNAVIAPYTARSAPPAHAAPDVTRTMPPEPRSTMLWPNRWVVPSTVLQLRASIACHTGSGWSRKVVM